MKNNVYLGSHIGMSSPNYFLDTAKLAIEYGENTFMFYTGAPQNSVRVPLEKCKIKEGLKVLKDANIDIAKVVCHAPYIINLANRDPIKHKFAIDTLVNEINRTAAFNVKILVLHPGSSVGEGHLVALNSVVEGLDEAILRADKDVTIALETMAGKGNEVGSTFEDLAYIISQSKYKDKLGVCFDTCHTNDSGYDLENIDDVLSKFDKIIGLNKLKVIHLNDSKNIRGSHKDRHENIGFGTIGFDTLIKYVFDPRTKDIPKILETPYVLSFAPYKFEINMINSKKFDANIRELIIKN
jgi:deoxyribonuclease-4